MKRHCSHQLETRSRLAIKRSLNDHGWTADDLHADYGEDILVRVFRDGRATPLALYVQAKATQNAQRLLKEGVFRIRLDWAHVEHWSGFWEPVVIMLFDDATETIYWESVQHFCDQQARERRRDLERPATLYFDIPSENRLDEEGLRRLHNITVRRHERYLRQREGADALISMLKQCGVRITDYAPERGLILIEEADGGVRFMPLGEMAGKLAKMSETTGKPVLTVVEDAIKRFDENVRVLESGEVVATLAGGVRRFASKDEFKRYLRVRLESIE